MEIWITRQSAFSLQVAGVDRLQVWFTKPSYFAETYFTEDTNPFGYEREIGCRTRNYWAVHHGKTQQPVSFGGIFGYEGEFVDKVWNELIKHFGNTEFREWDNYEKANKETCNISNFLLHVKLDFSLLELTKIN